MDIRKQVPRQSKKQKKSVSYGILLFTIKDNTSFFLIQQQRDSYAFIELMHGKWETDQQLKDKISNLTPGERHRILNYTYEELWYDVNISYKHVNKKRYMESYEKFFACRKKILNYLLSTPYSHNKQALWSLPKGRRKNTEEYGYICAIREFEEETNISNFDDIFLYKDLKITNKFIGEDFKEYITIFFVAEIEHDKILPEIRMNYSDIKNIRKTSISSEVENITWTKASNIVQKVNPNYLPIFNEFHNKFPYLHNYERIKLSDIYINNRIKNAEGD